MLESPVNEMPPPNVMKHHIPTSKGHQLKKIYLGCPQNSIVLIYFTQWRTYIFRVDQLYRPNRRNHRFRIFLNLFPFWSRYKCHNTVRCPILIQKGAHMHLLWTHQSVDTKEHSWGYLEQGHHLFSNPMFPTLCT